MSAHAWFVLAAYMDLPSVVSSLTLNAYIARPNVTVEDWVTWLQFMFKRAVAQSLTELSPVKYDPPTHTHTHILHALPHTESRTPHQPTSDSDT